MARCLNSLQASSVDEKESATDSRVTAGSVSTLVVVITNQTNSCCDFFILNIAVELD